jgi:hypothetical protein
MNKSKKVKKNPSSMSNTLPSAKEDAKNHSTNGIHAAAKKRKAIKKEASATRRKLDKEAVETDLEEMEEAID